jgi:leader peptidase (prepilin peptidase) / N-methyltransferase
MPSDLVELLSGSPAWFAGCIFILGLIVGSFLNVVIYRLPLMLEREWRGQAAELSPTVEGAAGAPAQDRMTLSTPRSACPSCKTPIKAWQNIPVVSWLLLRGRCAACQAAISKRYPLVELATAVLSAWVAWHFGVGVVCACALLVTWALIALTGIDIDHQLLPDSITLPLLWAGLLASVLVGFSGNPLPVGTQDAIVGAAAGYVSLWLVFHLFRLATGKEGMGYGDFKLFAALGAWLGWKILPLIILLSAFTGAVIGVLMIVVQGRDRAAPMPFGPYLAAAGWLAVMYGNTLMNGYLRLTGLQH